jgi:Kef-type K+ transport system membrane component KefB
VVAIAWFTPMLVSFFRISKVPTVVLEILFGYLLGHFLLQEMGEQSLHILEFLALSGFIFLMFLSGLEIDTDQIIESFPRKKVNFDAFFNNPLLVGLLYFVLTLGFSYLLSAILSYLTPIANIWYFSLIMVTTSVGIILPVLKNRGELKEKFGQMLIVTAAIADIFSIILFTFTAYILKKGFHWDILLIFALMFVFGIFYFVMNKLRDISFMKRVSFQLAHAASQINVRGSLLLILIFTVLAQFIDDEVVLLGAFLSGLLLSFFLHKDRSLIMHKLDGMGFGFFIPIFFIMVGIEFDPASLKEFDSSSLTFLIFLALSLFAVKIVPSLLWVKVFGWKRAVSGGFLVSSRLSLIIAAAAIGLDLGIISPGMNAAFIILAIITCFLSPLIYNLLNPTNKIISEKIIIAGGSSTGVLLARRLKMHNKKVIIIENDEKRCKNIYEKGMNVVQGDVYLPDVFQQVQLNSKDYVVIETGNREKNYRVAKMLVDKFKHQNIIVRVRRLSAESKFKSLGIETVDARGVVATTIENLILRPTTYHTLIESFEKFSVEEIIITNTALEGKFLRDIPFSHNAVVMLIKRGTQSFIPRGDIAFRMGDKIHIFGTDNALEAAREILES